MGENGTLTGTFVEPKGTIRSIIGHGTANAFGTASWAAGLTVAAKADGQMASSSPVAAGSIAYLGVTPDAVILFRAKRGLLKPKATDELIANAPRTEVASAVVAEGRLASVLTVTFTDQSSWTFDIPKIHLKGAREIVAALSAR